MGPKKNKFQGIVKLGSSGLENSVVLMFLGYPAVFWPQNFGFLVPFSGLARLSITMQLKPRFWQHCRSKTTVLRDSMRTQKVF